MFSEIPGIGESRGDFRPSFITSKEESISEIRLVRKAPVPRRRLDLPAEKY